MLGLGSYVVEDVGFDFGIDMDIFRRVVFGIFWGICREWDLLFFG